MKRWLLLLALAVFFIVCGLLITSERSKASWNEPSYDGRSLSSWLTGFGSRPIGGGLMHDKLSKARRRPQPGSPGNALRAMGTNAIASLLLRIKQSDDPAWVARVKAVLRKQKFLTLPLQDPQTQREQAAMAFYELGPQALSALPELATMLTNYSSAVYAAHALAGMGEAAIPAFASALTNSNTWISDCGVWGLAQIGPESHVVVPQILLQLPKGNTADQMLTLWALSEIREPVEIIRLELANQLKNSDPGLRTVAANALHEFGADAKPVSDEIKAALDNETDSDAKAALQKLAKQVNPDADLPPVPAE